MSEAKEPNREPDVSHDEDLEVRDEQAAEVLGGILPPNLLARISDEGSADQRNPAPPPPVKP